MALKRLANIAKKLLDPPEVGTTPADPIHRENKWQLLHYRPAEGGPTYDTPVLLVPSLINRHYVLDLMPGKSFVEYLVNDGHDVYIIDWGTPGPEDRYLTFDDYCDRYIGRAIRKVAERSETGKTHVLGYCLGGTLTTIHSAVHDERIESHVAVAAPIDFHDDGLLSVWSRMDSIDLDAMVEAFGNVPWPLMQAGFHLLKPTMNLNKLVYMLDRAWDDQFLEGFFAVETWGNDNVSFPGACFKRYIQELYRENALIDDQFYLSGRPARLDNITVPTLAVTFEHDHIVPAHSASVLLDRISSEDAERLHMHGGHVGAVVSRKASKGLWPKLSEWFAAHDGGGTRLRDVS